MAVKQSYEKLLEALRTIKDECQFHGGYCSGCPLAIGDYSCGVTGQKTSGNYDYRLKPQCWDIQAPALLRKKED